MSYLNKFRGNRANKKEVKRVRAFLEATQSYFGLQSPELVAEIEAIHVKTSQRFFKIPPPLISLDKYIEFFRAEAAKEKYELDISSYHLFIDDYLNELKQGSAVSS